MGLRAMVKWTKWGRGQTMTEYALIAAVVILVLLVAYNRMGTSLNGMLNGVDGNL